MENKIQQILDELYLVDSGLKAHEDRLKSLLGELLAANPNIQVDEQFRNLLRSQLLSRAGELKATGQLSKPATMWTQVTQLIQDRNWRYGLTGAFAVLLLAVSLTRGPIDLTSGEKFTQVGNEAFGSLAAVTAENGAVGGRGGGMGGDLAVRSQSGGGGVAASAVAPAVVDGKMIYPYPGEQYVYVYKGEDFELPEKVNVLRRVPASIPGSASSFLKNLGIVDLSTFSQARTQNVTLVEDKPFGYMISIFFDEGTVNINENWARWNHPEAQCQNQQCYETLRLRIQDMPGDAEVIAIADKFLADHKISKESYGAPEPVNDWRIAYEQAIDKSSIYIPDTVSISYPLVLNGQPVYEDGGFQKHGLYVSVNVRERKVSSVGQIAAQKFQSSQYAGITDKQQVLDILARGGRYGYIDPNAQQKVEVGVGRPTMAYVKIWQYKDNSSNELLVPALVFPVLKAPEAAPWAQKQVIVPLAKDLLDSQPPVRILEGGFAPAPAVR